MTFGQAVLATIDASSNLQAYEKRQRKEQWLASKPQTLSNAKARQVADSILGQKNAVRTCAYMCVCVSVWDDCVLCVCVAAIEISFSHPHKPSSNHCYTILTFRSTLTGNSAASAKATTSWHPALTIASSVPLPMLRTPT
jgi:hypothetical protein